MACLSARNAFCTVPTEYLYRARVFSRTAAVRINYVSVVLLEATAAVVAVDSRSLCAREECVRRVRACMLACFRFIKFHARKGGSGPGRAFPCVFAVPKLPTSPPLTLSHPLRVAHSARSVNRVHTASVLSRTRTCLLNYASCCTRCQERAVAPRGGEVLRRLRQGQDG